MALLDSELARCKFELGFNLISTAQPYIGDVVSIFETIIQQYLGAGAVTTASTVVAANTGALIPITLTDATGFVAGQRVVVDVDEHQETVTSEKLTGAVLSLYLKKAHSGTYAVTVEGGESIVRECLQNIRDVKAKMATTFGEGPLKKVDEIEFYQAVKTSLFGMLGDQLTFWRDELASALGLQNMWRRRQSAGSVMSLY